MKRGMLVGAGLTLAVLLGGIGPAVANPFDGNCSLSGDGSSADPFILKTESDLIGMEECAGPSHIHFALGANIFIDSGVKNFTRDAYFENDRYDVTLDGRGYGIYGLAFGDPSGLEVGIFGDIGNLVIKDITLTTGAIVGGNETSVVVGEAQSLVATNVVIINDSLTCQDECGLLAGRVVNDATLEDIYLYTAGLNAGQESGIAIGVVRGSFVANNVVATGLYSYHDGMGEFGGLVGLVLMDSLDAGAELSLSNIFVGIEARTGGEYPDFGPDYMSPLIGELDLDSISLDVSIQGVAVSFVMEGAETFGGLIGRILMNDSENNNPVVAIDVDDVTVSGLATYRDGATGIAGGLIGDSDISDTVSLNVDDALISIDHWDGDGNSNNLSIKSLGHFDAADVSGNGYDSVTLSDVVLDTTIWDQSQVFSAVKNTEPGITELTAAQLGDIANIPFENVVANPGVLGTDDWEHCSEGLAYPSFVPNLCSDPVTTLSGNSMSVELTKSTSGITDNAAKGIGNAMFYSVEPSLPRGMFLNPVTGTISGTPVELKSAQTYALYKYNAHNNPLLSYFSSQASNPSYFVLETTLPVVQQNQQAEEAEQAPAPPQPYSGPVLVEFSERSIPAGQTALISVSGERFDTITKITVDGKDVGFAVASANAMVLSVPELNPGSKTLFITSSAGSLQHQGAFSVVEAEPENAATPSNRSQKVNAGSFKGFVAIYASGYEGQRLTAKVGNDWVVVESLASNFERVVEFTGAGYTISVPIYINRVLVDTITVTTK